MDKTRKIDSNTLEKVTTTVVKTIITKDELIRKLANLTEQKKALNQEINKIEKQLELLK
jgi:hypothetical protein